MRINLRQTKPMKRDLVYTTDDWRLRPFDPTRVFAPSPHQNRQFAPPVEKVGLARLEARLAEHRLARKSSSLGWLFAAHARKAEPIKGLYLYGEVGRGKTMLMDI